MTAQELRRLADVVERIGITQLNMPVPLRPDEHYDLKRAALGIRQLLDQRAEQPQDESPHGDEFTKLRKQLATAEQEIASLRDQLATSEAISQSRDASLGDFRDRAGEAEARIAAVQEKLQEHVGDLEDAIKQPAPARHGLCETCGANHDNEVRLNRALVVLLLKRDRQLTALCAGQEG